MTRGDGTDAFLPLPASVMQILVALADGEKHGYAIMRDLEGLSGGAVRMGSGTLYGSIRRMLDQGLIEEADGRPDPWPRNPWVLVMRLTLGAVPRGAARLPAPWPAWLAWPARPACTAPRRRRSPAGGRRRSADGGREGDRRRRAAGGACEVTKGSSSTRGPGRYRHRP